MRRIIFYSWQSDLPNATNRGFIQQALEKVAASIVADDTVAVEPVIDRDTQGVPGSPDIASTIFAKIAAADIVVADVSITTRPKSGRACPNPNVLIELGYAFRALGHERVLLVFNRAYGKVEELPFDLRMRRVVAYDMPAAAKERAPIRLELEKMLNTAVRSALGGIPAAPVVEASIPAVGAIEGGQANRIVALRRNLEAIFKRLDDLQPPKVSSGGTVENLIEAIDQTQEVAAEFSRIAETVAAMDDLDAALEMCRWFGRVFECYHLPKGFSGTYNEADFDYFKFVGHELFVSLIAFLLRERRWGAIERLLQEPIPMRYKARGQVPGMAHWDDASEHLRLLLRESERRRRMSLHADILHARHSTGGLAGILPFDEFAAADFLLFLRAELARAEGAGMFMRWRPWSCLFLENSPMFLLSAEKLTTAEQVARVVGVPNVAEFRKRFKERAPRLRELFNNGSWDWPIRDEDIDKIGQQKG